MKKLIPLFLLAFISFFVYSCDNNDDPVQTQDNDTIAQMKDITGTFSSSGGYTISQGLNILNTDVVLVYRNINSNTSSSAIWQLLPKTFYLSNNRELDYNFIFNSQNVDITTQANFDQSTMTSAEANKYLINQNFRIVLVPANAGKNSQLDYNDYNSVIKFYHIDESKVVKIKVN
ncbi:MULTISPECIES: hypothetical protein [Chryseobacterium]|uniref:Uncharacterized protein n=1 Tax=Chryseobacterium camelliae TaxID=1265445 RepID=A0ABU0TPF8_9FLAO|nr:MULTISPECIES: hypothetical protein [Chryseobacterium]MDT3407448.1 hypothetical protein [Pseudacidovorax intermedius]MDQ1098701.1 hypothetical protein [Chryseobacterium camelliae]MDQ1102628.1 hypothetical protein [Chryseobacterium sp. SORGH_AS_1048]MDR6086057.1 hypothetical protein [Chryseobacterium sp. SORGH_AS_0909]MDR6130425.1 hypothetical protein [Chryseobacterium sp. SORGH_AS_1175]